MSTAHSSRPTPLRSALLALAAVIAAVLALTGTAQAAPGSGQAKLTLKAGAESSLQKRGIVANYRAKAGKTGATKRLARAKGKKGVRSKTLNIRVTDVALGGGTTALETSGAITLSAAGKRAVLTGIEFEVDDQETAVSATLGGRAQVFFLAKGKAKVDSFTIKLSGARLSLTGKGARAIGEKLGIELSDGAVGTLSIDAAKAQSEKKEPTVPTPAPTTPDPEKKPEPDPYPYASECPVGNVDGAPGGFGDAPGIVSGILPAPTFDPDTSQALTGTSVEWGFKNSFRDYVLNIGAAGSLQVLDGAGANPNGADMGVAGSFFDFPVSTGTYEAGGAGGHLDDKLVAEGSGTVLFCKSGHGFSYVIKNPTLAIDSDDSRITADIGVNVKGTWYGFQRADIATLNVRAADLTLSDGGNTIAWEDIPVTLSADGAKVLGNPYPVDTALDPITVKTTIERPLQSQCAIDEGTASSLPTIDFAQAELPELVNPVEMTGDGIGTINWGFRRSTRNTAQTAGDLVLLGGATESHPGNMGGGTSGNPGPGLGKFFRFPVSSYSYEVGTASPTDDRLIATSDATVGFCIEKQGEFGIVISKPTLVIDGNESRIVANAYSYSGPDGGWVGGRVDLVSLDGDAVPAVTGAGAVKWGDITTDNQPLESGLPPDSGVLTEVLSLTGLSTAGTTPNPPTNPTGGWDPVAARIKLPAEPYPYATECPTDKTSGGPPSKAPGEVVRTAPLPAFNAGTSQAVTGTEIDWGFQAGFRAYVINGLGVPGSVQALDGAEPIPGPGAPMAGPAAYVKFPATSGTYEAGPTPGNAGDRLVAEGDGTMLLCKPGHGFNYAIRNPTVVFDGDNSRIVADLGVNENQVWYPYQRVDLAELDLSGVTPTVSEGGNVITWTGVPAKLSADGHLAGIPYSTGEVLDTVTVKTTLGRPIPTSACGVNSGTGSTPRPAVDFTKSALPSLPNAVKLSGANVGTINWGFRRSTRATVAANIPSGGGFQLYGGATESYPGNMGGAASPAVPPAGGTGKFFRFPISTYEYEQGEVANLKDDRLIATSEASVGFCNPGAGQTYGIVISKPALIIDGAESRIVANAYSYKATNQGWIGGRVDLVKIDPSAIDAAPGSGTITWGEVNANEVPLNNGIPVSGALLTNALSLANLTPAATGTGWDPVAAQIALPPAP